MNQRMAAIALAGLSLLGTSPLWAADKVELTTRVSGVVESVLVKPGQHVKKGAVLPMCYKVIAAVASPHQAAEMEAEIARRMI